MTLALPKKRTRGKVKLSTRLLKQEIDLLKRIRSLEAEPEDASILLLEASEASVQTTKRKQKPSHAFEMIRYDQDVFAGQPVTFPRLFSDKNDLQMKRAELATELCVIIDMAQPDLFAGPHIYSIQVKEPRSLGATVDFKKLSDYLGTLPTELGSGYIPWQVLYRNAPYVRNIVLDGILGGATSLEIAVRNPSTGVVERKSVSLS